MKIKLFWKPILWLALICYGLFVPASSLPTKSLFGMIPHFDKLVHFALFFVFCLLLLRPFKKLKLKPFVLAPLSSVLLGALLEVAQRYFTSSRSSDVYDFFANTLGILFATVFFFLFVSGRKWEKWF